MAHLRQTGGSGWRWLAAIFLWSSLLALVARAHDPGISTGQGKITADALELVTGFAPADVEQLLPPEARTDRKWTQAEFDLVRDRLVVLTPLIWEARAGDRVVPPTEQHVELLPGDNVSFRLVFPVPPEGDTLTLRAPKIPELPPNHRQFVIISDAEGMRRAQKLLNANDITLVVPLKAPPAEAGAAAPAAEPSEAPTFWGFIRLGVEHIWTGYDHLLFLFALLVVCRTFRSIVTIITCFTLAHSITLGLATLDIVNLPAAWVEPLIAASIVFVGVENLWRRGEEPKGRGALTFVFGLIHGFGFASVLRDLGVGGEGGQGIAMPLFSFNLGVELGQIAIAAIVLPIVWQLRKNETFVRKGVPALSLLISLAGLYWLLERTILA